MSEIAETLGRITSFLDERGMDYMIIGGYALPHYGRIRTTLDIDVAVAIRSEEEHREFIEAAEEAGYSVTHGSYSNPVCLLLDRVTGYEVEVWSRPDGVTWDRGTLERRREAVMAGRRVWIVSPEDFIVSKLARPDRGVADEQDVKSVLERADVDLDWRYLRKRAEGAGVWALLETIRNV